MLHFNFIYVQINSLFIYLVVLAIESRALHVLGKHH